MTARVQLLSTQVQLFAKLLQKIGPNESSMSPTWSNKSPTFDQTAAKKGRSQCNWKPTLSASIQTDPSCWTIQLPVNVCLLLSIVLDHSNWRLKYLQNREKWLISRMKLTRTTVSLEWLGVYLCNMLNVSNSTRSYWKMNPIRMKPLRQLLRSNSPISVLALCTAPQFTASNKSQTASQVKKRCSLAPSATVVRGQIFIQFISSVDICLQIVRQVL